LLAEAEAEALVLVAEEVLADSAPLQVYLLPQGLLIQLSWVRGVTAEYLVAIKPLQMELLLLLIL
jgi:hypothetical protein